MMLRGYRSGDAALLTGAWLPGELLGLPLPHRPALAEDAVAEPPQDHTTEVCVAPGAGFVRYAELDWVHRRARLEIGVRPEAADAVELLLKSAVAHGFHVLNLHRLHGWVTPAAKPPVAVLEGAGFAREAAVPGGCWLDGEPVEREIWGAVRHD
jgi:hypothetical protein